MAPNAHKSQFGNWWYKTSAQRSLLPENTKNNIFYEKMPIPHVPSIQIHDPIMQLLENSINHAFNIHIVY